MSNHSSKTRQGVALALAYSSSATATIALIPILPRIAQHNAHVANAAALVPMVLAIATLTLALTSPFVGMAADRIGPKRTLILGLLLCGLSGLGAYAAGDIMQLLAWRALAGIAMAAIIVAGNTLLAHYFKGPEQQRWIGYQMLTFAIFGVIVSLAGGWIGDIHWELILLAPCILFLLVPLCFAWLTEVRENIDAQGQAGQTAVDAHFPLARLLGICTFALVFSLLTFLPAYCLGFILEERGIRSASAVGYASAVLMFVAIPASAAFSAAANASLRSKLIFSSASCAASLFALLIPGIMGALVSASFTGLVAGFGVSTLFAWLMNVTPGQFVGRGLGMLQTAMYLGQFMAPVIGVALAPLLGGWGPTALYLGCAAMGLIPVAAISRHRLMS